MWRSRPGIYSYSIFEGRTHGIHRPITGRSVVISPRGVDRLRSGHLWVYRSDVLSAQAQPGSVVRVNDDRGNFQGHAFYSDKSQISIRLLTREDVPIDRAFFTERIQRAAAYSELVVENSEAFRLIYSEADFLPSLIVDRYGDYLVIQTSQPIDRKPEEPLCGNSGRAFLAQRHPGTERSQGTAARRTRSTRGRAPRRCSLRDSGQRKRHHLCL